MGKLVYMVYGSDFYLELYIRIIWGCVEIVVLSFMLDYLILIFQVLGF